LEKEQDENVLVLMSFDLYFMMVCDALSIPNAMHPTTARMHDTLRFGELMASTGDKPALHSRDKRRRGIQCDDVLKPIKAVMATAARPLVIHSREDTLARSRWYSSLSTISATTPSQS
jgi:hypothetical protein